MESWSSKFYLSAPYADETLTIKSNVNYHEAHELKENNKLYSEIKQ